MFKIFVLACFVLSMQILALDIKALSVTNDKNSYDVYDGDILFTNQDKLQFTLFSKEDTTLELNYTYQGNKSHVKTIKLKKEEIIDFPKEGLLNFDKEGDVVFEFKNNKTTQKFHIKYIKNSSLKLVKTKDDIKYALNPNEIIGNSRGLKKKKLIIT